MWLAELALEPLPLLLLFPIRPLPPFGWCEAAAAAAAAAWAASSFWSLLLRGPRSCCTAVGRKRKQEKRYDWNDAYEVVPY